MWSRIARRDEAASRAGRRASSLPAAPVGSACVALERFLSPRSVAVVGASERRLMSNAAVNQLLPADVELAGHDHDATVASIATSSAMQSEEAGEEAEGEAEAEAE